MQAVRIHQTGGPEVLTLEQLAIPQAGNGEVLLRQTAIGINFIDIYQRMGFYKLPSLPMSIGQEGAGVVEAVGAGVTGFKIGDRVAYCGGPVGAYMQYRVIPAVHLVTIPGGVSDQLAAAVMLKGLTAHYLLRRTFPVQAGHTILWHAAAGGVGLIACQWANHLGATVIGTVGSEEKAALAHQYGCHHIILYRHEDIAEKVRGLTGSKGVEVAYDSVGKTTFMASLDSLKRFGMLVSFGQSSGPVGAIDPLLLSQKGSLYLTRPTLMHHIDNAAAYAANAAELFDLIARKVITVHIGSTYALAEAKQAHIDLEARKTSGALLLIP